MRRRTVGFLVVLAGLWCIPGQAHAGAIQKARKMLERLLLVDGAGSGLDADMVEGMRPDDITNATVATLMTERLYFRNVWVTFDPGECNCVLAECQDGDRNINCGGRFEPSNGGGYLSEVMSVVVTGTAREACEMCGCNTGGAALTARAVAQCIDVP